MVVSVQMSISQHMASSTMLVELEGVEHKVEVDAAVLGAPGAGGTMGLPSLPTAVLMVGEVPIFTFTWANTVLKCSRSTCLVSSLTRRLGTKPVP